jgi:hypothetical protein
MSGVIEARQRLDSQLQENELVLKVRPFSSPFPIYLGLIRDYLFAQKSDNP